MSQARQIAVVGVIGLILSTLGSGVLAAQTRARLWGIVTDENGEPIPDVVVKVTDPEEGLISLEQRTNKKGRYTIAVVDATRPYDFTWEKEGYQPYFETIKLQINSNVRRDLTLKEGSGRIPGGTEIADGDQQSGPATGVYNDGVLALRDGNDDVAEKRFLAAIERDPEFHLAYSALARLYFQREEWEQARDRAEKALELNDSDQTAMSVLFQAYDKLGEPEKSKQVYRRLTELADPAVAAYNVGADAFRAGDMVTAKEQFLRAVEIDPELPPVHVALARVYANEQDWEAAAAVAERALTFDATDVSALGVRYDAYRALGQEEKAAEALQALKEAAPDQLGASYFERAVELFNASKMGEAKALFEEVLTLDPEHARAHYMLGLTLVNSGDSAAAKVHLSRFVELAPDDPDAAGAQEMLKYLE